MATKILFLISRKSQEIKINISIYALTLSPMECVKIIASKFEILWLLLNIKILKRSIPNF